MKYLPLALLLVAVLVACRRDEPPEVWLGLVLDLDARGHDSILYASQLAMESLGLNRGLMIGGRLHVVKVAIEEAESTPEGSARAVLELINQRRAVAIVGSSFSRGAIPAGEVAEKAGVPMISPGSTHPDATAGRRYVFRVSFTDPFQSCAMAEFARHELVARSAAILFDVASTSSADMAIAFRRAFESIGGEVVAAETYTSGDDDFRTQLARIRAARPDALFLPNFSTDVAVQARQVRELGIEAALLGVDSWLLSYLTQVPELAGAFSSQGWHEGIADLSPQARAFIADYRRAYGEAPDALAALTYDAFRLLFQALSRAEDPTPDAIRRALADTVDFPGVTGKTTYQGFGGDPQKPVFIVEFHDHASQLARVVDLKDGDRCAQGGAP